MKTKRGEFRSITAKGKEKSPQNIIAMKNTKSIKTFFLTEFYQFSTVCDCQRNTRNV